MFAKSAQYYDLMYSFKNYGEEVRLLSELIRSEHPSARTILDVACGTGEHAKLLHEREKFDVDGIDLDSNFIDIASRKNPDGLFVVGNMSNFDLSRTYDVVQCLFSSIGYLTEGPLVVSALEKFKNHLNPHGIILIEPWFSPEDWTTGTPHLLTAEDESTKLCRMNVSQREGNLSILDFHYLIGTAKGVEHFTEDHRLALYTQDQMLGFFETAELSVQYDEKGIFGRGLYIARVSPGA